MQILNSLIFFGAPKDELNSKTLENRVNLARAKIYFDHTKISLLSLFLGLSIGIVLLFLFEVSLGLIATWALMLGILGIALFRYESFIKKQVLTPSNLPSLISKRLILTFVIALVWSLFIQLMPDSSKLGYTLSYIAMVTFIHIGFLSYSIIPIQFIINFLGVLLPFEIVLFNQYFQTEDIFFAILGVTFILCEGILFLKALVNAKTAIHTIILQEKLKDEVLASAQAKEQVEYLAYHDQLTGAWNRHYIQMQLEFLYKKKESFGILVLDINYFKQINDNFGHFIGDAFLVQFVKSIQDFLPQNALLGRFGGDEFIIMCKQCTPQNLKDMKQGLKTLLDTNYQIEKAQINGSTSIGVALFPHDATDLENLITIADKAMYADKQNDHLKHS